MCGGKWYVENVCMYAALFRLYSGIIIQTPHSKARCRCRKVPQGKCSPWRPSHVALACFKQV